MCGFAVAIDWPEAQATTARLTDGIRHRGDVTDPVASPLTNVAMCTRRLCILDWDRAVQPQASFDGKLFVSYNGEIYNHAELRQEMTALGVPFKTESDTEVLVNALRLWGARALERISGMYAFVAVEADTGVFLAARDPFGMKPLYVVQDGPRFLFCSEIKPLLAATETAEVMVLPPGYLLTRNGAMRFPSLLRPATPPWVHGDPQELDRRLKTAVDTHVPPDLPFATFFSGGIDSTLIAHYAHLLRPEAPGYFAGNETAPDYPFAAEYAAMNGYDMRMVRLDPASLFARIPEALAVAESFEPNLIRSAVSSLAVAEQMHKDGFRVALCGEGADELFCGYAPLELTFLDGNEAGRPVRADTIELMNRVCLQRVDRCSMAHQLETRVPFLDPAVAAYALSLDAAALVRVADGVRYGKVPLRQLYDLYPGQLPQSIRDRSKMPFDDGCGLGAKPKDSLWKTAFNEAVSDADFEDAKKEFADFLPQNKEEVYYLRHLSQVMDIRRVPHMKGRAWISTPLDRYSEQLRAYSL